MQKETVWPTEIANNQVKNPHCTASRYFAKIYCLLPSENFSTTLNLAQNIRFVHICQVKGRPTLIKP